MQRRMRLADSMMRHASDQVALLRKFACARFAFDRHAPTQELRAR